MPRLIRELAVGRYPQNVRHLYPAALAFSILPTGGKSWRVPFSAPEYPYTTLRVEPTHMRLGGTRGAGGGGSSTENSYWRKRVPAFSQSRRYFEVILSHMIDAQLK